LKSAKVKNSLIAVFELLLIFIFISCGTILDANDINAINILHQISEIEPEITQDDFFAYPLDTQIITSYFGYRRDPLKGDRHFHNGIDFSARIGEAVMASMDGVVSLAIYNPGYGYHIKINHSNGYKTLYSHLSSFSVQQGDEVKRGQKIGESGNTGNTSGPHLHFTIFDIDDNPINPLEMLRAAD